MDPLKKGTFNTKSLYMEEGGFRRIFLSSMAFGSLVSRLKCLSSCGIAFLIRFSSWTTFKVGVGIWQTDV